LATVIAYAFAVGLFLGRSYKEKLLLQKGNVAPAIIVKEENIAWGDELMAVTYQFTDTSGKVYEGVRKDLPRRSDKRSGSPQRLAKFLDNPTVIYNPDNAAKNILYPSDWFICKST